MRSITTDYNNSAFYSETKFTDTATANGITIAANKPVDVRALNDSVSAGAFVPSATSMDISAATLTPAPAATANVSITTKISTTATPGIPVKAVSSNPSKVSVSPAVARAGSGGSVMFTVSALGANTDTATLTFSSYGAADKTCAVIITA